MTKTVTQGEQSMITDSTIIFQRIFNYQRTPVFHPLTCGYDSGHRYLEPKIVSEDKVVLVCKDCDYVQQYIPDMFFENDYDKDMKNYLSEIKKMTDF